MLDVYRHVLSLVHDTGTRASASCACRLFRDIVRDELKHHVRSSAPNIFGSNKLSSRGQQRAKSLLENEYRRIALADFHTAQEQQLVLDGRAYAWDWCNLPAHGKEWLASAQLLLALDQVMVLLYDCQLELLGVLSFQDRRDPSAGRLQPSSYYGKLSMLLIKCPLQYGAVFEEPLLRLGAAEYLGGWRLKCAQASAMSGRPVRPVDDDIHMLRIALFSHQRRPGLAWGLLAAPGRMLLTATVASQAVAASQALSLRCLDVSGCTTLPDEALAQLLCACPHLLILRAASSSFGPACLAALCGRAAPRQDTLAPQRHGGAGAGGEQPGHAGRAHGGRSAALGGPPPRSQPQPLPLSLQQQQHAEWRQQQGQQGAARCPCPAQLQVLDIAHCSPLSTDGQGCGPLLPRALSHLRSLQDLRLSGLAGAGVVFEAAERLGAAKGSSAAGAALLGVLGQLTRLDLLEAGEGPAVAGATTAVPSKCRGSAGAGASGSQRARGDGDASEGQAGGQGSTSRGGAGGGLGWGQLELALRQCTSLRHLAVSSRQLAEQPSQAELPKACMCEVQATVDSPGSSKSRCECSDKCGEQAAAEDGSKESSGWPSLLRLEVGWGAGGPFLWRCLQSSPFLASLTVHAGAAVSDWHLQQLAGSCPYLARLELRGANVSDAGLSCVLGGCSQLTALRLYSCTGPLTDALALSTPAPAPRAPAFRLRDLHISWSNAQLSDSGLAVLLDPGRARLSCLVLRGLGRLTDAGLWPAVRQHAATLCCLELEHCGSLLSRSKLAAALVAAGAPGALAAAGQGLGSLNEAGQGSRGAGGVLALSGAAPLPAPLSVEAAIKVLAACRRLQALTVRGSIVWSREAMADFARQCSSVVSAVLDD